MFTYVALLRGINVGGNSKLKMNDLRKLLESINLDNVQTYIQSGNIIFNSSQKSKQQIGDYIKAHIKEHYGYNVSVMIFSPDELKNAIYNNPYSKEPHGDIKKLYVTFLSGIPNKSDVNKIKTGTSSKDEFTIIDNLVYLYCPNGYGRTKLTNNYFERLFNLNATTRNWRTILKLEEMSSE